jgi:hypothetical protein
MDKERVFGLTIDEVGEIKQSIAEWTDSNSPLKSKKEGGSFCDAMRIGSKLLREDRSFTNIFDVQR